MRSTTLIGLAATGLWLGAVSCTEAPIQQPLRSLQSSGPVAFVCLGAPSEGLDDMARPLTDCSSSRTDSDSDYAIPHLYTLVTQPLTGEIAVVDLTAPDAEGVIDQNPAVPGSNFLPVGALPTDIVATPGGTATFVSVAETNFEAIYALPSDRIRGSAARLSSWPACALPAAPGRMLLALDPADAGGDVRPSCEADYGDGDDTACTDADGRSAVHCHGDLGRDAERAGRAGRYKLVVALPSEGGIAVIDAQSILDQDAGARPPCTVERWLPLEVALPPPADPPEPPASLACVPQEAATPLGETFTPVPAGMTLVDDLLYIADRGAPVIHRVDLRTPCDPREIPPLAPRALEDPARPVFTTSVAVSPLTLDLKRFVYAIDFIDGSLMVFDVSDDGGDVRPLARDDAYLNPFQPADRIRFRAPPREVVVVQHQNDGADATTGSTVPVRCDPVEGSDGPGTIYRTAANFESGAGPARLRGVFAFAVLTSGDVVTIDIDDYDAPCRGPKKPSPLFGCEDADPNVTLATSGEYTCNVVVPNQPRSSPFLITQDNRNNQPGINTFPVLFDSDGTVLQLDDEQSVTASPVMTATLPTVSVDPFTLVVGSDLRNLDRETGQVLEGGAVDPTEHTLAMNLEDPRAHIVSQDWTVRYEGALPGFDGHFAELVEGDDGYTLRDPSVGFCFRGAVSQNALAAQLVEEGLSDTEATQQAATFADYVSIITDTPVDSNPYWEQQTECTFNACQATYGNKDAPRDTRDLRIVEATEDALALVPRNGAAPTPRLKCCMPGVVEYRVRGGNQWIVTGSVVGFLHDITVADDGTCRPSCNPDLRLLDGRVRTAPGVQRDGEPFAFRNPFFRFSIAGGQPRRDMHFRFTTSGQFEALSFGVVATDAEVQPTHARYLPITGELVVSDGSLEGISLIDLNTFSVTRQHK